MSGKKVVKSAVCIIPPKELWSDIQDLRRENDKAYARWPPHINLLYPFVPVEEFGEVAPKLAKAIENISPFSVTFENFSFFPHGTIFCDPQTKIEKSINVLQSALESAVPFCNDQSSKSEGFHAHLTVGQVQSGETAENTIINYLKYFNPISFNIDRVFLIARKDDEPFKIHYQIFLREGKFEKVEIPYSIEQEKKEKLEESEEKEGKALKDITGYQVGPNHARVVLDVPATLVGGSATSQQKQLLFVIDISGSMSSNYNQVKEAVKYMIENQNSVPPLFIVFDHTSRQVSADEVLKLSATGGTSFAMAIKEINNLLRKKVVSDDLEIAVVFMTDGQDGDRNNLPTPMKEIKELIKERKKKVVVHTIAFGAGADLQFLNSIRTLGPEEGMMRQVKETKLTSSFAEIFDFLDITKTFKIKLGNEGKEKLEKEVEGEMKKIGFEDFVSIDIVFGKNSKEYNFFLEKGEINAQIGDHMLALPKIDPDIFFNLRGIENMEIITKEELNEAQNLLQNINPLKANKTFRQEAVDMKTEIQEQLNKFHQAFADMARGTISGNTNILQSLRYDFKFNKSRRVRTMNQRATKNASAFANIEKKLAALKLTEEEINSFSDLDYTCPLSGDSIFEVMTGSATDVMVFSLRVTRPEHAIDAPTGVQINDILSGTYSNYAFQQSMAFALKKGSAAQAHGGFSENSNENMGFFKGPDGKFMNACLPLYINEHHWKRVEIQLEPLLGYFFTLDPLGFKGDQYLALFMILGNMIFLRNSGNFKSEWANFLIEDFKKLCTAVKPKVIKYLKSGFYANGLLQEDPLIAFLKSPAGRTKQVLQNIMVIVGWAEVSENFDKNKFLISLVEEVWRRNFSNYYKAQPREIVMSTIEKLIYGPPEDSDPSKQIEGLVNKKLNKNDKEFVLWAEWKLGKASKRKGEEIEKKMKEGPNIEGTLAPDTGYTPRNVVDFEAQKEFLNSVVDEELNKIKDINSYFDKYTEGAILGNNPQITKRVKWILVLQALQYCSNDLVNSGVSSGSYKNSIEYLEKPEEILEAQHQFFDTHRKQNWENFIKDKNNLITAEQIIATKDIWAFIGRMMKSCPTRGGPAFDAVISYLHSPPFSLSPVPLLNKKIEIIFTGKFKQDEEQLIVHAEGSAWVHCSEDLAKKFKQIMGEDNFSMMEAQLYGHWGWVYRPSDIPNRHGHCNSNPNPLLSKDFNGFGV